MLFHGFQRQPNANSGLAVDIKKAHPGSLQRFTQPQLGRDMAHNRAILLFNPLNSGDSDPRLAREVLLSPVQKGAGSPQLRRVQHWTAHVPDSVRFDKPSYMM